jgi:hypothetical protein
MKPSRSFVTRLAASRGEKDTGRRVWAQRNPTCHRHSRALPASGRFGRGHSLTWPEIFQHGGMDSTTFRAFLSFDMSFSAPGEGRAAIFKISEPTGFGGERLNLRYTPVPPDGFSTGVQRGWGFGGCLGGLPSAAECLPQRTGMCAGDQKPGVMGHAARASLPFDLSERSSRK